MGYVRLAFCLFCTVCKGNVLFPSRFSLYQTWEDHLIFRYSAARNLFVNVRMVYYVISTCNSADFDKVNSARYMGEGYFPGTLWGPHGDLVGTLWEYSPRKLLWISQVCGRDILSRQMQNAQKDLKTVTMVPPMSLLLFLDIHIKLIRLHKIKQVWEGFNREY